MADLSLWYSLQGRISRRTYWLKFVLPIVGLGVMAAVFDGAAGFEDPDEGGPASLMVGVLVIWPTIVSLVKRFHDLGHSGRLLGGLWGGLVASIILSILIPMFELGGVYLVSFGVVALI